MTIPHWPFYCEETAWQVLAAPDLVRGDAEALFIANEGGRVACWEQRVADPGEPIAWDYHVVVAELGPEPRIVDPDCRLGPILPAADWLMATFLAPGLVVPRLRPRFRPVPRARYLAELATDRSHMRRRDGRFRHPPPPWPPPGAPGMNLMTWLDPRSPEWLTRAELEVHLGLRSSAA